VQAHPVEEASTTNRQKAFSIDEIESKEVPFVDKRRFSENCYSQMTDNDTREQLGPSENSDACELNDSVNNARKIETGEVNKKEKSNQKRFSKVKPLSKRDSNLEIFGAFCSTNLPNRSFN
jgi:hypothetical protein